MTTTLEPTPLQRHRPSAPVGQPPLLAGPPTPLRQFGVAAWERRIPIGAFLLGVVVVASVVSLLLPNWFRAKSTILPPTEGGNGFELMNALIENKTLSHL